MKLYVSATLYYGYEIEVPDEVIANKDTFDFESYAAENDPIKIEGIDRASCEWYTNSIFNEAGEELYCG